MYHDAKGVFWSANVFKIRGHTKPLLSLFIRHLDCVSYRVLAVRNMDLRVRVSNRKEERQWDNGFCALAESVKNLREISIYVDKAYQLWWKPRLAPAYRKEPFLPGLLEFKKLQLKTFSLVLKEHSESCSEVGKEYLWTAVQQREWEQYVKGAVLGLD